MKKQLNSIERIYSDPKVTFSELIKSIIEIKADGTPKIFYRFSAPKIE
ncbi:hypothetical protein [Parageobacillus toebii]|nr:hypothetical protein [Parageobacillus toebii]WMT20358.1 hypothetical protein RFB12_07540 [Parageobacillus toebii]